MGLVVLADSSPEFVEKLGALLEREEDMRLSTALSAPNAVEMAVRDAASVIVFGPSVRVDAAIAAGQEVISRQPSVEVVLVAQKVTPELLRMAMRAGFHDVVSSEDNTYGDVSTSIRSAHVAATRARESDGQRQGEASPAQRSAQVVTVFGTKGGVGKSVIASNLAIALVRDLGKKVILVDLDLEFGDAAIMLKLEPKHTIYDAAQAVERLDTEMLRGYLIDHSSGLKALLAPRRAEDAESVTTARISRIINLLAEMADFVVIDTAGRFDEVVLTAIDRSDHILAIATMEVPSIKNTKVSLEKLRQLGYGNGTVRIVLNRADSKVHLDPSDVENVIGGKIAARIPSDRAVPRSVNKGVPVVVDSPKSHVAKSMVDLARSLSATTQ